MSARNALVCLVIGLVGLTIGGCASIDTHHAVAVVHPTPGHNAQGVVHFHQARRGVVVTAEITGLNPNQKHGFHLHAYGDATASDATSAGGHYDPQHTGYHAEPNASEVHHAGDLGNLLADARGHASYEKLITHISVAGHTNPILGRAVIIHAAPDDFGQPTGNAGDRAGIGIIGVAKPQTR